VRRTITVTGRGEIRSGTSATGRDWTLWWLTATDADGQLIHESLKSFDPPAVGRLTEVELEPDSREEGCFLVKPLKGSGGGGSGQKTSERLDALEARVDWLAGKLAELGGAAPPQPPEQESFDVGPPAADDDDDIPF
jgi:hypothetical protein